MAVPAGRPSSRTGVDLSDFRGPEPEKLDDDRAPTPPVDDDDHSARGTPDNSGDNAPVEPPKADDPPKRPAPSVSPFDAKRNRIAERFAERRKADFTDTDMDFTKPENVYGKLAGQGEDPPDTGAGNDDQTSRAPAKPGPSASEGTKPEPMTLVVNGKTLGKSLAEVAALADMTEDEVKADPARAKRYAQRELATSENLQVSKSIRRETPSRTDDAGARPADHARHQGGDETGDDGRDQQQTERDTSADDLAKLVEDIQIGDPKEVAPKLAQLIERAAGKVAKSTVNASENDKARATEINAGVSAFKGLLDEHPELADKPSVAAALGRQLDEEYRTDIRSALIAEGNTPEDADAMLAQATQDQIRNAHLTRRQNRDPHVRRIDRAMADHVYSKVFADFGVTVTPKQQQQQTLTREQRKQALPHQPQRASVPSATVPPPAPKGPESRRAVVAEMASRTGKRRSSLPTS